MKDSHDGGSATLTPPQAPAQAPARLGWGEKIGYAVGDTASCLYWQTFSMFLMIFYTDTFGISPTVVGTMFLITRIWDAAIDPVMGVIADRTQTRHGKFRPWILWGILPFAAAGVLLFVTPDFGLTGKIIYAYATYTLVMMVYTMVNVPYGALLGVISADSQERTALASCRFVGAFAGNIIVQGSLIYLVARLGGGNDRLGYPLAMGVLACVAALLLGYTFLSTRERVKPPQEHSSVRSDLRDLLRNRPWLVLCLLGLATLIYISVRNAATLYYFKYYIGSQEAAAPFMVTGTVFSILGAMATPFITRFLGSKRRSFVVLTLICSVAFGAQYFVKPGDMVLLYALNIVQSAPCAALFPLIWSMYADTADYGEWRFGRRATGLVFSAATFAQKMGWAVGGAFAALLLDLIHFVPNAGQSPESLAGIRHMMSTIPAGIGLVVAVLVVLYRLDAATERRMHEELSTRTGRGGNP